MSSVMLILGLGANIFLWKVGLFGYGANPEERKASLGYLQWLSTLGSSLTSALVVSAIEVFGKRPGRTFIKAVFWLSLGFSLLFDVLSGMKSAILQTLISLALIYCIVNRRFPRSIIIVPLLFIMFLYPFVEAYRARLNNGYSADITSVSGQVAAIAESFHDAFLDQDGTWNDKTTENAAAAAVRLSNLDMVRTVISLPDPSVLQGNEKLWLAPIYPFVPRIFWGDKPVLNKGVRLSIALGAPSTTSTAPTLIGDLYSMYGSYGVAIGMILYGVCIQQYMNRIGRNITEKRLFVYILMLPALLNLESDLIGQIGWLIQTGFTVFVTSHVVYGRPSANLLKWQRFREPLRRFSTFE